MSPMSGMIRWFLIIPAAVAAWCVAYVLGIGMYLAVERLCPANQMEYGRCIAPWFRAANYAVIVIGAALAAALVMITCTSLAPTHKREVAFATFVAGTIAAYQMGRGELLGPMLAAIGTGAFVLAILLRRLPPSSMAKPNT